MKLNEIKKKFTEYIGPVEAVIILIVGVAAFHYCTPDKEAAPVVAEPVQQMPVIDNPGTIGETPLFKVMDERFGPYLVDTLCRYSNEELTQGCITLQKKVMGWQMLCSTESRYYMWVQLKDYFPNGQLLYINKVLHSDSLVQFHFTIEDPTEKLLDLSRTVDSINSQMQKQKSRGGTE